MCRVIKYFHLLYYIKNIFLDKNSNSKDKQNQIWNSIFGNHQIGFPKFITDFISAKLCCPERCSYISLPEDKALDKSNPI